MNPNDLQEYIVTADTDELEHIIYQVESELSRRENEEEDDDE